MTQLNLKLLYEVFDPVTKTSKLNFKYHLIDGKSETVIIPKDKSCKTKDIHAALVYAGSAIPRDFKKCEKQLDFLLDDEGRELRYNAQQLGWQNNYKGFLSPLFKLGDFGGKNLLLPASMQDGTSIEYSRIGNSKAG
jgi:phosphoglycerate-specific signal transduction histidine kinase